MESSDIIQDFAIFLLEKNGRRLHSFRGRSNARFSTFIVVVFRNWLYRKLHAAYKETPLDEDLLNDSAFFSEDFALKLHGKDLLKTLSFCMGRLDKESREIIYERFYMGLSIAEIARNRGLNTNSLYSRFYCSLKNMKQLLKEAGFGPENLDGI